MATSLDITKPHNIACPSRGRIVFENPNNPEQPAKGVYRWFYVNKTEKITIYIGCAGNRIRPIGSPSTLYRGILEAKRSCISSDKGKFLDTDFIVGSALIYIRNKGHNCYWQHISNVPSDERNLRIFFKPELQPTSTKINRDLRLPKPDGSAWANADWQLAEKNLFRIFSGSAILKI